MKNLSRCLILTVLIFVSLVGSTFAQKASIIAENANLRDSPSNTGKVVTVLSKGTEVIVLKQSGAWFHIQSGKFTGWAHGKTISSIEFDEDANAGDACDDYVTTIKDRMTDRVMTVGLDKVIVSPDNRTGFAISLYILSESIVISIQYAQPGSSCIDKEASIYVLFEDDTKVRLEHGGGFNCDQKATVFLFPRYNQDTIDLLSTKKIQAIRVTTMRASIERDFSTKNATLFKHQFSCLRKSLEEKGNSKQ